MKTSALTKTLIVAMAWLLAHQAQAQYLVPSTANIFSAGLGSPVDPSGGGAGTLPIGISLSPGQGAFQFSATGSITENNLYNVYHGPDGRPGFAEQVYAYGGVSGFITDQNTPLVGIFLSNTAPGGTPPPTLDFSSAGLGLNFTSLAPALDQVFFIGDGQTSGGVTQTFYAPAGATRLFLGIPDTVNSLGYPGGYADNAGSFSVTVTPVPEPALFTLSAMSAILLLGRLANRTSFPLVQDVKGVEG